jgi:hypothetical protein
MVPFFSIYDFLLAVATSYPDKYNLKMEATVFFLESLIIPTLYKHS